MTDFLRYPIVLRELQVARVTALSPHMTRVTLTGSELGAFSKGGWDLTPFKTGAPDDHIKIFLTPEGREAPVLPAQQDGYLNWPQDPPSLARDYTVRGFDEAHGELDIDIVLHDKGPVSGWLQTLKAGDVVNIAGPKGSFVPPRDVTSFLLLGDETGLPSIARWLEAMPPGTKAQAFVEVDGPEDELPIDSDVPVTWLHRNGRPAGTADLLIEKVRTLDHDLDGLYVWAAAEVAQVRKLRTYFNKQLGISKEHTHLTGYWRRSVQGVGGPLTPEAQLRQLTDLETPYVIRLAATLRLPDLVAAGSLTGSELAEQAGVNARALQPVLSALVRTGILTEPDPGLFGLGDLGQMLIDDDPAGLRRQLDLRSAESRMAGAWAGLEHVVRTGEPGYPLVYGRGFWDDLGAQPALSASFDRYLGHWAEHWVPIVARAIDWSDASHVADIGGGTGLLLEQVLEANVTLRGTLVELPETAERARQNLLEAGLGDRSAVIAGSFLDTWPAGADTYVLSQVLHDWQDAQAAEILRRGAEAIAPGGRIRLIERVVEPSRSDFSSIDLLMLVLFGSRERTLDEFRALADQAGLTVTDVTAAGAGFSAIDLVLRS